LKKYFISSKKHSISLEKHFISLKKYFISSKKHSNSLEKHFISLKKDFISLKKQRSLINNSAHFQFSRTYSSKKDFIYEQIHPDSGFDWGILSVLGLLLQNFFANLIEFFKRANLRDETKHLLARPNLFNPMTIEQCEALSYCL